MKTQATDETLRFFYTAHLEEARAASRDLFAFTLGATVVILSLSSLVLGYEGVRQEQRRIIVAKNALDEEVGAHPVTRDLSMKQFLNLGASQREAARTILQAFHLSPNEQSPLTLGDAAGQGLQLEGGKIAAQDLLKDIGRATDLLSRHSNTNWQTFQSIPEKRGLLNFPLQSAPRDTLIELASRYHFLGTCALPTLPDEPMDPLLRSCLSALTQLRDKHQAVLGALSDLFAWDNDALKLPVHVFTQDLSAVQTAYGTLLRAVGVKDEASELYTLERDEPKPEKTSFGAVYGRLLARADNRLRELDTKLSANLEGVAIQFPIRPIVLAIPLIFPAYLFTVVSLRRERNYHLRAGEAMEGVLGLPTNLSVAQLHLQHKSRRGNPVWYRIPGELLKRGTSHFLIAQAMVCSGYAYLFLGAFRFVFRDGMLITYQPLLQHAAQSLYSAMVIGLHGMAIFLFTHESKMGKSLRWETREGMAPTESGQEKSQTSPEGIS